MGHKIEFLTFGKIYKVKKLQARARNFNQSNNHSVGRSITEGHENLSNSKQLILLKFDFNFKLDFQRSRNLILILIWISKKVRKPIDFIFIFNLILIHLNPLTRSLKRS